jgi:tetratricopeptide (TPR) repeat protein
VQTAKTTDMASRLKSILLILLLLLLHFVIAAQPRVAIKLSVNNKQKLTVYRDEPLLLSVFISSPAASANEQWNREAAIGLQQLKARRDSQKITVEQFNVARDKIEAAIRETSPAVLGSAATPISQLTTFYTKRQNADTIRAPLKLLDNMPAQLVLSADSFYVFQWGIDRKAMLKLFPGIYLLNVVIDGFRSNTVQLTIQAGTMPATVLETEKMQSALGRFCLRYENADSAIFYAKKILRKQPSSVDGLVLLGDAYVQKRDFSAALKAFQSALQAVRSRNLQSPEPPEYILGMIEWLKGKV